MQSGECRGWFQIQCEQLYTHTFRRKLDGLRARKVCGSDHPPEVAKNILDHARMWGAMSGTEIKRQSIKFLWLQEVIDGGGRSAGPDTLKS